MPITGSSCIVALELRTYLECEKNTPRTPARCLNLNLNLSAPEDSALSEHKQVSLNLSMPDWTLLNSSGTALQLHSFAATFAKSPTNPYKSRLTVNV